MSFIDPKERVISIELTSFGKKLLSKGKFKPEYYAFMDDDVIYDGAYAGLIEHQNDIQTRIKENTPYNDIQPNVDGIETNVKRGEEYQNTRDKGFLYSNLLGNSYLNTSYIPSWNIKYLNGSLSGSVEYLTGSNQSLRIPQLSSSVEYITYVGNNVEFTNPNKIFPDGTMISVKEDYILLEVTEENTRFLNDNFDIEVYKIEEVKKSKIPPHRKEIKQTPLFFETDKESQKVGYYLDVLVDNEIDKSIMCKHLSSANKKDIFSDNIDICDETEDVVRDITQTPIMPNKKEC